VRLPGAIGIAAPSINAHFADVTVTIDTVVADQVARLHDLLTPGAGGDPVDALHAAVGAYLIYQQSYPNCYRIIFERRFLALWDDEQRPMTQAVAFSESAFSLAVETLRACIDTGASTSTDAYSDTVAIWAATPGLVTLPHAIPSFA